MSFENVSMIKPLRLKSWLDIDRMKEEDVGRFIRYHVDTALEGMRCHVRSEGNEPSF